VRGAKKRASNRCSDLIVDLEDGTIHEGLRISPSARASRRLDRTGVSAST
jgi:hypothetical protein